MHASWLDCWAHFMATATFLSNGDKITQTARK